MITSYLIYIGLLILCIVVALIGVRKKRKECVWIIVLALTLIAGFRHSSVGIDTISYLEKFEFISNGEFEYAYGLEITFKIFSFVILKVFQHPTVLLTLIAFITNWCVIQRFWELKRIALFPVMVACYYMSFYFMTMNVMRQFCAIAILFYFTRYLAQKKTIYYIIGMVVAALFHQSALLGCALLLFEIPRLKELNDKHKKILKYGVAIGIPLILIWVILKIIRYAKYFNLEEISIGIVVPAKIVFFIVTFIFVFKVYGKMRNYPKWDKIKIEEKNSIIIAIGCYGVGLCFLFGSYFFPILNRMGWYFTIFECVYMGIITNIQRRYYKWLFVICACGLVGIGFVTGMTNNSQGTMPYLFFWQ